MEYVDGFFELGDVQQTVDAARFADANLSCTRTHIVERFPVVWIKPGPHRTFPTWKPASLRASLGNVKRST
jgi:hypothetical protein